MAKLSKEMLSKEMLSELTKDQLIYLIEQLEHSQFLISEICVNESKCHIDPDEAVNKIRSCIFTVPSLYSAEELKAYIDMQMHKISVEEFRKIIGLDE